MRKKACFDRQNRHFREKRAFWTLDNVIDHIRETLDLSLKTGNDLLARITSFIL